jgi:hypothetical protein
VWWCARIRVAAGRGPEPLASTEVAALGICEPFPPPVLSIFADVRTIEVDDRTVAMRFEGAVGLTMERVVHLGQDEHAVGIMFFPSGPSKHLVERLTLTPDRLRLQYAFTLEDPTILAAPVSYTATWDHRPDLQLSGETCDPDVARRGLAD